MTTTTTTTAHHYAVEDCSRCGGTGRHSWCQRFGDTCFQCAGKGLQLTRDAARSADLVAAWRAERATITADQVTAGMAVRFQPSQKLRRVTEVTTAHAALVEADGTRVQLLSIRCGSRGVSLRPDAKLLRQLTAAEQTELAAYMETLPGVFRA